MFNSNTGGYSLADVAAVTRDNGFGDGGNGAWWIILLFLFAFGGWGGNNGGFFGNRGNGSIADDISYSFDINGLSDGLSSINNNVTNGFYNQNTGMLNGFANTNAQICAGDNSILQAINASTVAGMQNTNALQAIMAQHSADESLCCCQTQNKIDSNFAQLNYNLASQECDTRRAVQDAERDLMENANNNTRQILDFLVQDRLTALTNENSALRTQISQERQNEYLLNQLRPTAQPSYIVANPYTGLTYPMAGAYGYGSSCCGCNA